MNIGNSKNVENFHSFQPFNLLFIILLKSPNPTSE